MLKHLLPVSGQMLAVAHGPFQLVPLDQLLQKPLALDLRDAPQVIAVQVQQVEGVEHQPVLVASCKFGLEFGEIGPAFMDDHYLSVDDGLAGNVEGAGDEGEALGPV
jgi:hypothetical protein